MKRIDRTAPKAMRNVWAWKDAIYRDVKHLPIDEALSAILDRAEEIADVANAERRLNDPKRKTIPLSRLKTESGL